MEIAKKLLSLTFSSPHVYVGRYYTANSEYVRIKSTLYHLVSVFILALLAGTGLVSATPVAAAPQRESARTISKEARHISPRETAMINSLLRQARQAHNSGDSKKTKSLLFQARQIDPRLRTPAWLAKPSRADSDQHPQWSREQLIEKIINKPDNERLLRLEEYVRKNPQDREALKLLTEKAVDAGAIQLLRRVEAFSHTRNGPLWLRILKWSVVTLLLAALIWPAYALMRDLKTS